MYHSKKSCKMENFMYNYYIQVTNEFNESKKISNFFKINKSNVN